MRSLGRRSVILVLLGLSLLHGLLYAAVITPWQAPDENWHFEYARLVYEQKAWGSQVRRSPEVLNELLASMEAYRFWQLIPWASREVSGGLLYQPPLYYWLGALALSLIPGVDIATQLYALRLLSVLMGTTVVLLAYLSIRALFPEDLFLQIGVPAFIVFLPMHTHITSSVNNDNLVEVVTSLVIYFLTLSLKGGFTPARIGAIGASLFLGFYTKRTFFFTIPLTLVAIPLAWWIRPPKMTWWRGLVAVVLVAAVAAGTTTLWREGILSQWWARLYHQLAYTGSSPDLLAMASVLRERGTEYAEYLFKSFWALFGWLTIELDPVWYWGILVISLAAFAGVMCFAFRVAKGRIGLASWQRAVLVLYALSVLLVLLFTLSTFLLYETDEVFVRSARGAQPQGRYLFPAIIPIATLFALGIRELVPESHLLPALLLYLVGLFAFDLLALGGYVIPYFYRFEVGPGEVGTLLSLSPIAAGFPLTPPGTTPPTSTPYWIPPSATPSPAFLPSPTAGELPTLTPTSVRPPTATPTATSTPTGTPKSTSTPTDMPIATPVSTSTATATATRVPALAGLPPFGVQLLAREYHPQVFALAKDIGARWARVYLLWSRVEPVNTTPDHYHWGEYDTFFARLAEVGLIPIVTIEDNPGWASTCDRCPIDRVPLSEFAEFMGALVERYQGPPYYVKYWEFYNEPDDWEVHPWDGTPGAWGGKGAQYAEMLKAVWPAVHNADPEGKVVLGGLAYASWSTCHPCFDLDFLDTIVKSGGAPYFDVMNFHYYPRLEGDKWDPPNLLGKALELREKLPLALRDKPVMCTEIGEPYAGESQDPPYSHELASRFVVQAFVQSMAAKDYGLEFPASTWFSLERYEHGPREYGLLDANLSPLPEYRAFQTMTRELAGARYKGMLHFPKVEGYAFALVNGREKAVVWATGDPAVVTFPGGQLRVVDKLGIESFVHDGGTGDLDGKANGSIQIGITQSPVYIEVRP